MVLPSKFGARIIQVCVLYSNFYGILQALLLHSSVAHLQQTLAKQLSHVASLTKVRFVLTNNINTIINTTTCTF